MDRSSPEPQYVRVRVPNACDSCKIRKVKCDGKLPCSYCNRHKRAHQCHFSPQRRRRLNRPISMSSAQIPAQTSVQPPSVRPETPQDQPASASPARQPVPISQVAEPPHSDTIAEEEAEVPREARLLYDAQGKLIFIGDCAPLSFFQTVRQLVLSRVDPHAFVSQTGRASMLQNVHAGQAVQVGEQEPYIDANSIHTAVAKYLSVTSGLADLFSTAHLADDVSAWAQHRENDVNAAVNYLVLAIGLQTVDESLASNYFEHAKVLALATLGSELSVGTVQAFTLITLYMLRACQITGAFLFFGIAVRAIYSIGAHRTEVNSRFGSDIQRHRDRLWKSLRIIDLFLSVSMGRPPATSDVDCTVPYREIDTEGQEIFDVVNASVQILVIIEGIVLEIYSRKKISLQLTEGISRQLREWSTRWLAKLKQTVGSSQTHEDERQVIGACQVLCSYYYAVMLVSRPFLMYEMCKRLPESPTKLEVSGDSSISGRFKLANACIDAGSLMIEQVTDLVQIGILDGCMPLVVSWMFAASLAVGVGLLGEFGRILEKDIRQSICALEHFAKHDAHALQYSLIVKSLHSSATEYLERKERYQRLQITESSSQLFGLTPRHSGEAVKSASKPSHDIYQSPSTNQLGAVANEALASRLETNGGLESSFFDDLDPSIFSFPHSSSHTPENPLLTGTSHNPDQVFGALNLFPLLEEGGHIDLAHYL
ncbi:fungal-specific transcription factor domain-containing protein [Xylariales sp. AK1849]|nr:fungal-specific transcription factor domain-containing protein [Xylariales sp. AK1849]